jgi:hypothetical protein
VIHLFLVLVGAAVLMGPVLVYQLAQVKPVHVGLFGLLLILFAVFVVMVNRDARHYDDWKAKQRHYQREQYRETARPFWAWLRSERAKRRQAKQQSQE